MISAEKVIVMSNLFSIHNSWWWCKYLWWIAHSKLLIFARFLEEDVRINQRCRIGRTRDASDDANCLFVKQDCSRLLSWDLWEDQEAKCYFSKGTTDLKCWKLHFVLDFPRLARPCRRWGIGRTKCQAVTVYWTCTEISNDVDVPFSKLAASSSPEKKIWSFYIWGED